MFMERKRLYESFATHTVQGGDDPAAAYAERIAEWLCTPPETSSQTFPHNVPKSVTKNIF